MGRISGVSGTMGIIDTVIDAEGRRHQTKGFPLDGQGGSGPAMGTFRVGERVPALDGAYRAIPEGGEDETVVVVRGGRVAVVHPKGAKVAVPPCKTDPLGDAITLLQDLYNHDVPFVEMSPKERRADDKCIRVVLEALGADHDGRE